MDVVWLSRLQFALTIYFHYLFPPLTIGMGVVLVYLEGRYLWTKDALFHQAAKFWTRIYALNFALGVATGIVMEFQFGTNWATYSRFVGDVFGSALAAEGIFAFFLESGFLAVLVFGWNRVSPRMHFFATCMVSLGSMFSAVWIVVANSWQQTPAGHHVVPVIRDGQPWVLDGEPVMRAEIVDFWGMVFNPSSVIRLTHTLIGCFIVGSFFILSISAWYILKNRHSEFAERSFRGALLFATVASLAALWSGHDQAQKVYVNQPAKLAAFEGHFRSGPGNLTIFGLPNAKEERIKPDFGIKGGVSWLLFGDASRNVDGLDRFRPEDRPPLLASFLSWRVMVGIGTLLILLTLVASLFLWRGTLFRQRWLMWCFVFAVVFAMAANHSGWTAAEVGRQPWVVHPPVPRDDTGALVLGPDGFVQYDEGLGLRTRAAVSRTVRADQVLGSIIGFGLIYALLFGLWLFLLNAKIQRGPETHEPPMQPLAHPFLETAAERPDHRESMTEAKVEGEAQ